MSVKETSLPKKLRQGSVSKSTNWTTPYVPDVPVNMVISPGLGPLNPMESLELAYNVAESIAKPLLESRWNAADFKFAIETRVVFNERQY